MGQKAGEVSFANATTVENARNLYFSPTVKVENAYEINKENGNDGSIRVDIDTDLTREEETSVTFTGVGAAIGTSLGALLGTGFGVPFIGAAVGSRLGGGTGIIADIFSGGDSSTIGTRDGEGSNSGDNDAPENGETVVAQGGEDAERTAEGGSEVVLDSPDAGSSGDLEGGENDAELFGDGLIGESNENETEQNPDAQSRTFSSCSISYHLNG